MGGGGVGVAVITRRDPSPSEIATRDAIINAINDHVVQPSPLGLAWKSERDPLPKDVIRVLVPPKSDLLSAPDFAKKMESSI